MATVGDRQAMGDPELIERARHADPLAFAELRLRHTAAAYAAARALCGRPRDATAVVEEAFGRMHRVLLAGDGPSVAFRPYLLVAVRNRVRDRSRLALVEAGDEPTEQLDLRLMDSVVATGDATLLGTAFAVLPERWQLVLWHADVELEPPERVAALAGVPAAAVTSLTFRARAGLRQAYVQAWLATPRDHACVETAPLMAAYIGDTLALPDRVVVADHVSTCAACALLVEALATIPSSTRAALIEAYLGTAPASYVVRKRSGMARWFGGLSGWQRAAALTGVAAAAVLAGVVTAAALDSGRHRPSVAAETTSTTESGNTDPATTTTETATTTTSETSTALTTTSVAPTSTLVMPTLPPGAVSRVPNSTTTAPATTTSTTTPATTVPATTVPAVPRVAVASSQVGVGVLAGQVRVRFDVTATDLPIAHGDRAFTGLGVSVPLVAGMSVIGSDNPAWICTSAGACQIASLANGASSSAVLTLALPAGTLTPVTLTPSISNPAGAQVQAQAVTLATTTITGLLAHEYARGSVVAVGNSVVDCTGPCQLMDVDGDPATATSSSADVSIAGQTVDAILVWSGVSNSPNRDRVVLTGPNGPVNITADNVVTGYVPGNTYVASANVTAHVSASGTYTVAGIRTSPSGPAGWSLIVMTHDDTQPLRLLMIATPAAYVTSTTPYSFTAGAVAPTSDVHLVAAGFGGTALAGDVVTCNGLTVGDAFHGAIGSTPRNPELTFNKGVDVLDVTAVDVGLGSGAVEVSTTDDAVLVAAVGLAVDVV